MEILSSISSSEQCPDSRPPGSRLRALLCFIVLNAIIYLFVNAGLSKLPPAYYPSDARFQRSVHSLENKAPDIDLLFIGDSFMYYGLNPDNVRLGKCLSHNFSFASETSQSSYWKTKYYIDRGKLPNLKAVVMEISLGRAPDLSFASDYSKFYPMPEIATLNNPIETVRVFFLKNSLLLRMRQTISGLKYIPPDKLNEQSLDNGYTLRQYSYQPNRADEKMALEDKIKLSRKRFSGSDGRFYKMMSDMMKKRNAKIYFVVMPTLFGDKDLARELYNAHERYIRTYVPDATVFDYSLNRYPWKPELFSDRGHLNEKGAEILGTLISQDLSAQSETASMCRLDNQ